MTTFICVFEPTTEARTNGAIPLTIAFNATNAKIAAATAMIKLSEAYPDSMDNFNIDEPIICEDAVGSPRPALDHFDEKFAIENEFDGEKWQPIKYKEFKKLATKPRVAALLLFGKTQITDKEYTYTLKYLNEREADPKIRHIATGLAEITKVSLMDAEATMEISQAVYEHADENVTIEEATALGESWLKDEPKVETVAVETTPKEEPILKRDYAMLDTEIALALIGGVDFDAIRSADIRKAKELISSDDKAWKRLSMDLRTSPSVLDIPRENIFALVTEAREQPELFDDANARKAFIDSKLGTSSPKVTSLGSGRFAVDNLDVKPANDETTKEEAGPVKPEKQKRSSKKKDSPAKTEKEPVKEAVVETEQVPAPVVKQTIQPVVEIANVQQDDFEQRAAVLEEVLGSHNDNLSIWKRVQRTDSRFTKPIEGMGFIGTSINGTYMIMRATEIFGPIGSGWNYEVIEEKLIDGKPLTEPVLDERNKQVATRFLRNGDGSLFCEKNHSVKIKFWYITPNGTRAEFESYGATPYLYQTQYGPRTDGEVIKKSLTDAIKKALSMLGFSSDVFMGMHDNPEYAAANKLESEIKAASDNAEDVTRIRKELDEKFTKHTETMRSAVTQNELRGIASTLTREISTHAKLAKERGNSEYEKYLNGRLRRLNEIEKECLDQLKQKEEAI